MLHGISRHQGFIATGRTSLCPMPATTQRHNNPECHAGTSSQSHSRSGARKPVVHFFAHVIGQAVVVCVFISHVVQQHRPPVAGSRAGGEEDLVV